MLFPQFQCVYIDSNMFYSACRIITGGGVPSWPAASQQSICSSTACITSSLSYKSWELLAPSSTSATRWLWSSSFSCSQVRYFGTLFKNIEASFLSWRACVLLFVHRVRCVNRPGCVFIYCSHCLLCKNTNVIIHSGIQSCSCWQRQEKSFPQADT